MHLLITDPEPNLPRHQAIHHPMCLRVRAPPEPEPNLTLTRTWSTGTPLLPLPPPIHVIPVKNQQVDSIGVTRAPLMCVLVAFRAKF